MRATKEKCREAMAELRAMRAEAARGVVREQRLDLISEFLSAALRALPTRVAVDNARIRRACGVKARDLVAAGDEPESDAG